MKRFLYASIITLVLCTSTIGFAQFTHATAQDTVNSGTDKDPFKDTKQTMDASYAAAQNAAAATPTNINTGEGMEGPLATIMNWIMSLFAWLVGVAAITLDNAVYYTVVTMGKYIKDLSAIGVTWRILRDIGNIMFIFGFLAVGITTILYDIDVYGMKKMLPKLLIGALFLNFSLFFAEAIVDVGNMFATQFYTQINGGEAAGAKNFDLTSIRNEGISSKLMNRLGLQTIYGNALNNGKVLSSGSSIFVGFMSIILFIITAFVMFSLAFILIARFVVLVFLIIVAPIGFAGLAIPGLASRAKDWWTALFNQTITAPILMLMLYIALAVITDVHFMAFGGTPEWSGFVAKSNGTTNLTGFAGMVLSFLVAMGLMLLVVVSAKRWSAVGGDAATKLAGKLSFGLAGWAASRTIGRGAYHLQRRLLQSKRFNAFNARTGRVVTRALNTAATGSFDVRGSGVFGKIPLGPNIGAGDAAKDGFVGARKRNFEDHKAALDAIGTAHEEAFAINTKERENIRKAKESIDGDGTEQSIGLKKEKENAAKVLASAQEREENAKKSVKTRQEEIDDMKKREAENRNNGVFTDESLKLSNDIHIAERKLAADAQAVDNLVKETKRAADAFGVAEQALKKAEGALAEAEKAPKDRMAKATKASKEGYIEGLEDPINKINPLYYAAYGPATGAAAEKLRDSLKEKSKEAKVIDAIKALSPKEEKKGEEHGKATSGGAPAAPHASTPSPAPAAHAAPSTPSSGGAHGASHH